MDVHTNGPRGPTTTPGSAGAPPWLRTVVTRIESDQRLDAVADALDGVGRPLADGPGGPALRGEPIGHALHPLLTDIPIGCWQSASILDVLGGRRGAKAARRLVGLGVLTAVPTAAAGLVELASLRGDDAMRRVAALHAAGNTLALGCYAMSWKARKAHRVRGAVWALGGGAIATFTGYLGGHMSFARGVGVEDRGVEDRGVASPPRTMGRPAPTGAGDDGRTAEAAKVAAVSLPGS